MRSHTAVAVTGKSKAAGKRPKLEAKVEKPKKLTARQQAKMAIADDAEEEEVEEEKAEEEKAEVLKTVWIAKSSLTKFRTLMEDLHKLRQEEPSMRAVVFTRHDAVGLLPSGCCRAPLRSTTAPPSLSLTHTHIR